MREIGLRASHTPETELMKMNEIDYPEQPMPDEYVEAHEQIAVAESNAPPQMLADIREFDRECEQRDL